MKHNPATFMIHAACCAAFCAACLPCRAADPVRMIFDTDMGNDIDDALALAVIHELADRGEVELLAVTLSKDNPLCAPFVDILNTFYGRPDVPIGVVKGGKTPAEGKFLRPVTDHKSGDAPCYPHDLLASDDAPDATDLIRRILASSPDGSVTLVSVGFMTNMARLLDSPADAHSPRTGRELASEKIRLYVQMAGAFSPERKPEYNVHIDADASRRVYEEWPTPIIASGFEIGLAITYPAHSIEHDYGWTEDHPVARAYRHYIKMPYDRPTWDLTAALQAARPGHGYFELSYPGRIHLNEKNITEFREEAGGPHRYMIANPGQITRVRETLIQMSSSPPGR